MVCVVVSVILLVASIGVCGAKRARKLKKSPYLMDRSVENETDRIVLEKSEMTASLPNYVMHEVMEGKRPSPELVVNEDDEEARPTLPEEMAKPTSSEEVYSEMKTSRKSDIVQTSPVSLSKKCEVP
jgi:hypothetical protein